MSITLSIYSTHSLRPSLTLSIPIFFLSSQHQLLEKAQTNLGVILDSPQESKELAGMLLKIADNCTSNLTVQQYVFTRVEEILGLGIDFADADIDVFGARVSEHFPLLL